MNAFWIPVDVPGWEMGGGAQRAAEGFRSISGVV